MAQDIDDSFVRQYESEVHEAYQQMGSKFRNTVRTKSGIVGESTTFQKVGKGAASTKARHGEITPMTIDHAPVVCTLEDWYAGDYVDKFDELKINHDERKVIVNAGAYALGRKTDELVIAEAEGTTNITTGATGLILSVVLEALESLGSRDAFEGGGRLYAFVGWKQWVDLMSIEDFKDADRIGPGDLPFNHTGAKGRMWLDTVWMPHTGLTLDTAERQCLWYNETALGHAIGADIETDVDWEGRKAAHFVNSGMSQGACLIDEDGVEMLDITE